MASDTGSAAASAAEKPPAPGAPTDAKPVFPTEEQVVDPSTAVNPLLAGTALEVLASTRWNLSGASASASGDAKSSDDGDDNDDSKDLASWACLQRAMEHPAITSITMESIGMNANQQRVMAWCSTLLAGDVSKEIRLANNKWLMHVCFNTTDNDTRSLGHGLTVAIVTDGKSPWRIWEWNDDWREQQRLILEVLKRGSTNGAPQLQWLSWRAIDPLVRVALLMKPTHPVDPQLRDAYGETLASSFPEDIIRELHRPSMPFHKTETNAWLWIGILWMLYPSAVVLWVTAKLSAKQLYDDAGSYGCSQGQCPVFSAALTRAIVHVLQTQCILYATGIEFKTRTTHSSAKMDQWLAGFVRLALWTVCPDPKVCSPQDIALSLLCHTEDTAPSYHRFLSRLWALGIPEGAVFRKPVEVCIAVCEDSRRLTRIQIPVMCLILRKLRELRVRSLNGDTVAVDIFRKSLVDLRRRVATGHPADLGALCQCTVLGHSKAVSGNPYIVFTDLLNLHDPSINRALFRRWAPLIAATHNTPKTAGSSATEAPWERPCVYDATLPPEKESLECSIFVGDCVRTVQPLPPLTTFDAFLVPTEEQRLHSVKRTADQAGL